MKKNIKPTIGLIILAISTSLCFAQPADPAASGMVPRTATFYVNTNSNNNALSSLGVDITSDTNVVIGFEDDATPSWSIQHWSAVWTRYDKDGILLTPEVEITNGNPRFNGVHPVTNILTTYRAFFRNDGSPTLGRTAWGPKIKANRFGGGFGMSANSYAVFTVGVTNSSNSGTNGIGLEIPHLYDINLDDTTNASGFLTGNGFAALQLVNNDGTSAGPTLAGGTDADYQPIGGSRTADWDYLANGNIVTVDQSSQAADQLLTGQASGNVVTYRVQTPAGVTVKAWSAASSAPGASDMWHGVGVTSNGFAIRWGFTTGPTMRLFDNDGNPASTNINIGTAAQIPALAGGGRGDGTGFHGNGTDAYVYATHGGSPATVHVAVFNANGTLRWARRVADAGNTPNSDRLDAAIHPDGRVVVIFDATNQYSGNLNRTILGRMFDRFGTPLGGIFWVSELENPTPFGGSGTGGNLRSRHPRVAWRGDMVAVVWDSVSAPFTSNRIVGARLFDTAAYIPVAPGDIANTSPSLSGTSLTLNWTGGSPPFKVQKKSTIDGSWGDEVTGLSYRTTTVSTTATDQGYYRVVGQGPQ